MNKELPLPVCACELKPAVDRCISCNEAYCASCFIYEGSRYCWFCYANQDWEIAKDPPKPCCRLRSYDRIINRHKKKATTLIDDIQNLTKRLIERLNKTKQEKLCAEIEERIKDVLSWIDELRATLGNLFVEEEEIRAGLDTGEAPSEKYKTINAFRLETYDSVLDAFRTAEKQLLDYRNTFQDFVVSWPYVSLDEFLVQITIDPGASVMSNNQLAAGVVVETGEIEVHGNSNSSVMSNNQLDAGVVVKTGKIKVCEDPSASVRSDISVMCDNQFTVGSVIKIGKIRAGNSLNGGSN